jgi:hypothetical protein
MHEAGGYEGRIITKWNVCHSESFGKQRCENLVINFTCPDPYNRFQELRTRVRNVMRSKGVIMKSVIRSLVVAGALAIPAFAFAQATDSAASQGAAVSTSQQAGSSYGGVADGSAAGGQSAPAHHRFDFLRHGNPSKPGDCVGPVSFCQIYFGG